MRAPKAPEVTLATFERTPLGWCLALVKAKAEYERLYPDAKPGRPPIKRRWAKAVADATGKPTREAAPVFVQHLAATSGLNVRCIQKSARIGCELREDEVTLIRRHDARAAEKHLIKLVALDDETRAKVLAELPGRTLAVAIQRASAVDPRDEAEFMRALMIAWGARREFTFWRQNCGSVVVRDRQGAPLRQFDAGPAMGAADLIGFCHGDGLHFEVEVKGHRTKLSRAQETRAKFVREAGAVYYVARYDEMRGLELSVALATRELLAAIEERRARKAVAAWT